MPKKIILTLTVECEDGEEEDFARSLADHIMETFNDDESIIKIEGAVEEP